MKVTTRNDSLRITTDNDEQVCSLSVYKNQYSGGGTVERTVTVGGTFITPSFNNKCCPHTAMSYRESVLNVLRKYGNTTKAYQTQRRGLSYGVEFSGDELVDASVIPKLVAEMTALMREYYKTFTADLAQLKASVQTKLDEMQTQSRRVDNMVDTFGAIMSAIESVTK